MKFDELLEIAEFFYVTPEVYMELLNSESFYQLTWYPPGTDIKDNEVGLFCGKRVIVDPKPGDRV